MAACRVLCSAYDSHITQEAYVLLQKDFAASRPDVSLRRRQVWKGSGLQVLRVNTFIFLAVLKKTQVTEIQG